MLRLMKKVQVKKYLYLISFKEKFKDMVKALELFMLNIMVLLLRKKYFLQLLLN